MSNLYFFLEEKKKKNLRIFFSAKFFYFWQFSFFRQKFFSKSFFVKILVFVLANTFFLAKKIARCKKKNYVKIFLGKIFFSTKIILVKIFSGRKFFRGEILCQPLELVSFCELSLQAKFQLPRLCPSCISMVEEKFRGVILMFRGVILMFRRVICQTNTVVALA